MIQNKNNEFPKLFMKIVDITFMRPTSTETYNEIGTTVLATIAYEKNTNKPIIVGPRTGSFGIIFSQGI